MDIEIKHTIRKSIQKIGIMRNDDDCFFIGDEKIREMLNPFWVEIVGRLIEEKNVRVLDKSGSKKEASLLSS
jgi:hypothetical protein